ncbi:MAG: polysaccharide biosynthesis protein [Deltaproteobacteria bacterium]|nr:polysaccharide biosynthesis protein [Deltaproteobacteria bacterium]
MLKTANIFVTGGAGTLGRAIARRRKEEGWTGRFTVYSRDNHKHQSMRKEYPDLQYVQGDIRTYDLLYNAMAGHDVVIHAAACKVIPDSEFWSIDTFDINVTGSRNVFEAARALNVAHVLAISTDKACHPANAYGATKMLMEKELQEYARVAGFETEYHLVRYGNVLESNGSVVEAWKNAVERGETIKITDPDMTRFWLSPRQAVDYVVEALKFNSGQIYVPKMPALSIEKLAEYVLVPGRLSKDDSLLWKKIPLRPGEKKHETLLTEEEREFCYDDAALYYVISPTTTERVEESMRPVIPFSSDVAQELTRDELIELLND